MTLKDFMEEERREMPRKLHEWYLEACQRPESGMDFNPAAQEPYDALKDTQKFLDQYIADKVTASQKRLIEKIIQEMEKKYIRQPNDLHQDYKKGEKIHCGFNAALDTIINLLKEI